MVSGTGQLFIICWKSVLTDITTVLKTSDDITSGEQPQLQLVKLDVVADFVLAAFA